jgi:rare lipoprotein A
MERVYRPARLAASTSGDKGFAFKVATAVLLVTAMALSSCSSRDPFAGKGSPLYPGSGPLPKGGGRYLVGEPYQVAGRRYYPREDPAYDKVGIASWYGPGFHRRMTSNGEWFDQDYLSAAHPTLPLPSYARVTNLENGRNIVVRVNDRGPFVDNRVIDLSKKSADVLGVRGKGTAKVRVKYIGPAPLNDKGTHLAAMNRSIDDGTPSEPVMVAEKPRVPSAAVRVAGKPRPASPPVVMAARPEPESGLDMEEIEASIAQAQNNIAGFYVQVGSFSDPSNAGRAKAEVASVGPVVITPIEAGISRLYRVRIGPLRDESEAHAALAQVQAAGHHDARLVFAQN